MKVKSTFLIIFVSLISLAGLHASDHTLGEDEYYASSIRVLNNSATMLYHKNYFITHVSGKVGKRGIPTTISTGDSITVKNKTIRVNYIIVSKYRGTSCLIVESKKDIPTSEWRNRLWINVEQCSVLSR